MKPQLRQRALAGIVILLLAGIAAWSYGAYAESRRRLATALASTQTCREVAAAILQQRQPVGLPTVQSSTDELHSRLQQAAEACGLEPQRVIRAVRPQPPQPVQNTGYQQQNVELSMEGLTLEHFVRFLHQLQTDDPQLLLNMFVLQEPKGLGRGTLWSVQPLVVSRRVASPLNHVSGEAGSPR